MDDRRFDSLVKALAQGRNRRSLLKGIVGFGATTLASGALLDGDAEAARRPTPTPTPPRCPGKQTLVNGVCTCPGGLSKCGPDCCNPGGVGAAHSECCDNACCFGTCYGKELCCPTNSPSYQLLGGACVDLAAPGACYDQSNCPAADVCTSYACQNYHCVASHTSCDDNNACTTDSCDPVSGCVHTWVNCDDGNMCTIDSCDPQHGCIHTPVACDDGNPCTVDRCDPAVGCVHTPVDCSGLTNPETCVVGVCAEGTCTAQSSCANGTFCCGDGTCDASCDCDIAANGDACSVNEECCGGCCIVDYSADEDWIPICEHAGLSENDAVRCAEAISEGGYASTCLFPNRLVLDAFPNNPVTLPCVESPG